MRWINCPSHRGDSVKNLLQKHFEQPNRRVLLLGGAGFDPRAQVFPLELNRLLQHRLKALLLKEERPKTTDDLISRANDVNALLTNELNDLSVVPIEILSRDLSLVGGRRAVSRVAQELSNHWTDIVVDVSALSTGISFPIIRCTMEWADQNPSNNQLHIVLAEHSIVDQKISSEPLDRSKEIFGFKGNYGLESTSKAAKLWLPQLAIDQREALNRIYDEIRPHDVCPILPFPSRDPRAGDRLLEHFANEILNIWEVTPRNVIYAAEGNPLDLYRTVLRIDDERKVVFREADGSQLLLTPTGSKALALGAVMAAIERNLPVRYVESIAYNVNWDEIEKAHESEVDLLHLWLAGEPYLNNNESNTD
ncbi:MAG: hypothetical protein F4227_01845 [Gammaproteobacteria bacterium]|nr:hypothetical protein [Gammaproteobacteria bacterium]MYF01745.1 hypothetical protein [Gammaproteobacteria bacterium]MYI76326.1 hypothetical protein [Gammaproteobacteria bacterium]